MSAAWIGEPDDSERAMLLTAGADPAAFVVYCGTGMMQPHGFTAVESPQGPVKCIVIPFLFVIPATHFKRGMSPVLDARGQPRSPAEGVASAAAMRVLIPRACLVPEALGEGEGAQSAQLANGSEHFVPANGVAPEVRSNVLRLLAGGNPTEGES